jgi:hypothetical protein
MSCLELGLSNTPTNGSIVGGQSNANSMDDTVVAGNVDGIVRKWSESLLSENGVIHEILTELARVGEGLALEGGERSTGNGRSRNLSRDDAVLEHFGVDRSNLSLVSFNGGVSHSKDSEGSSSLKCRANTRGSEASVEKTEVIVSLEFSLTLILGNTIGSPDLSGTLERGKSIENVGVHGSASLTGEC